MILSPDKGFIFVHVPKAAGTSIAGALSLHDVFLPVRRGGRAEREAHLQALGLPPALASLGVHASALQLRAVLGPAAFGRYYSFAFVRNPWDVAVSWYHYRLINPQVAGHVQAAAAGSFEAYVRRHLAGPGAERLAGVQHPYLVDEDGAVAVSAIGKYENLPADFAAIVGRLGIETLELDRFNQSYHAQWQELYTPETFAIVAGLVSRDAALFGYAADAAAYGIS